MKHYLVTGGAGFIGSHLVEALLAAGHRVTVLDDFSTGKRENLFPEAALIEGNINDPAKLETAFDGVDGCFHLAAIPSVTQSIEEWSRTHRVNLGGAVAVFEAAAARGVPVVYASSAAVYGDCDHLPLQENESVQPLSPYGLDKLGCEMQARIGAECKNLRSVGLRFFNVYGPRQDPASPYSGVISIFIHRIRKGLPVTIFGDGRQSRDFIFVGDVVEHLIAGMNLLLQGNIRSEILNVATELQTDINKLVKVLMQIGEVRMPLYYAPARSGEIRFSCGGNRKAKELLGIQQFTPIEEGLRLTWHSMEESQA